MSYGDCLSRSHPYIIRVFYRSFVTAMSPVDLTPVGQHLIKCSKSDCPGDRVMMRSRKSVSKRMICVYTVTFSCNGLVNIARV